MKKLKLDLVIDRTDLRKLTQTGDTMRFIVHEQFKDGNLAERMNAEGLPAELTDSDAVHRFYVYNASPTLLRSLNSAGCKFTIIPDDEETFKYIYNITFKE